MNITFAPKLIEHLELREKALKKCDAVSLYRLAQIYASMKDTQSEKRAFALYKISAAHGYAESQFMVGLCYEIGIGVKQDHQAAIFWYTRAETSAASDIKDTIEATNESSDSTGIQQSSLRWLSADELIRAAKQGDPKAQERLGAYYHWGSDEFEKNYEEAVYWYRRSAEQGYEAGIHHLAKLYKCSKQYKEAVEWYRKYAELRIKQRKTCLGW